MHNFQLTRRTSCTVILLGIYQNKTYQILIKTRFYYCFCAPVAQLDRVNSHFLQFSYFHKTLILPFIYSAFILIFNFYLAASRTVIYMFLS